jgi:hypothetical protein
MARRPNYGFEKRQRELRKQKKNEEKAENKRRQLIEAERLAQGGDAAAAEPSDTGIEDGS